MSLECLDAGDGVAELAVRDRGGVTAVGDLVIETGTDLLFWLVLVASDAGDDALLLGGLRLAEDDAVVGHAHQGRPLPFPLEAAEADRINGPLATDTPDGDEVLGGEELWHRPPTC